MKNATIIVLLLFFCKANAQEVVPSSGGHFQGSNFQISWTVGEPVIETGNSDNRIITQGMHQSKLIVTSIKEIEGLKLTIIAYPNPAIDYVQLEVESTKDEGLDYHLYGMDGSMLRKGRLSGNRARIPMQGYTPSAYLLNVVEGNRVLKAFKIIKIN